MRPYLSAALALVALAGCSSAKKSDGVDPAQRQMPLAPVEATLTHSNVSQFDDQVAIQVKLERVGGNTVVTIPRITSWPVQNTFLGLDRFYYGATAVDHPLIEVKDEGCDELVVGGEACGWNVNFDGCVASGFGCFASRQSNGAASHGATTQDLVFVLRGDADIAPNDHGAQFAVHARFNDDCSAWFSDGTATEVEPEDTCKPWTPQPPVRTCSLSVTPSQLEIVRGSWGGATVTVEETGDEPLVPVTLSIEPLPLPAGVTVGLAPNPVNPPGTSMMTVQTMETASPGVFALTLVGQGQAAGEPFRCSTTLELKVREPPPQNGACYCPIP